LPTGWAPAVANDILDALCRNDALATLPVSAFWIQLHTADPGAAGTNAVAGNDVRKQATFGNAASAGSISNTAAITWTSGEVDTSEDYTHWSAWDASTLGNFKCSGTVTANAVTTGDQFTIPVGDLDISLAIAA
jgi:hypothetical protein